MGRQQYESKFIAEVKKSFLYYFTECSYWYKIPDDRMFKKPYDVIAGIWWKKMRRDSFALEMKVHRGTEAWLLSKVQDHQVKGLLQAHNGGFLSAIMLKLQSLKKNEPNVVRIIPILEFMRWQEQGKKSISVNELKQKKERCLELVNVKEVESSLWNVYALYQAIFFDHEV